MYSAPIASRLTARVSKNFSKCVPDVYKKKTAILHISPTKLLAYSKATHHYTNRFKHWTRNASGSLTPFISMCRKWIFRQYLDVVICCHMSLNMLTMMTHASAEIYHVLKPGGFVIQRGAAGFKSRKTIEDKTWKPIKNVVEIWIMWLLWSRLPCKTQKTLFPG